MIFVVLIVGIPLLDLGIKYYIEENFEKHFEKPVLNGKLLIRKVHNKGMIFNFLDSYPKLVRILTGISGIGIIIWMFSFFTRENSKMEKISICMAAGGAISNIYDRFLRKYVVDYFGFKTKWKKFTDITFNLGDLFIFAGMIGILISFFSKEK